MCRICVEWEMGKLTTTDAMRNLGESLAVATDADDFKGVEHLIELSDRLIDADVPFAERDLIAEGQVEDMMNSYDFKHPEQIGDDE